MKLFIFCMVVCLATVYGEKEKNGHKENPEMKKWSEECAKDHKIDLSTIKLKKGDKKEKKELSNDMKCFKRCMAMKTGCIDEAGKPNYDKIKETFKLNDAKVEEIKNCTSTANDKCDNYYEMYTCGMKVIRKDKKMKGDKKGKKE